MAVENWSENIVVAELQDEPVFSDDLNALFESIEANPNFDVVLNFSGVTYVNSSNIAKLLRLRKEVSVTHQRKLKLCGLSTHVWGLFLTTGLDKVFDFADNVAEGLAGVQLD